MEQPAVAPWSGARHRAVRVAVVAVGMMQVALDEVVDMITVRHRLVPAAGAVNMTRLMAGALVIRRAGIRVRPRHLEHVLVDMVAVRVVQMTIVQIVDVIAVADRGVAAGRTMHVRMAVVVRL